MSELSGPVPPIVIALVALPFLLYIPGLLVSRALPGARPAGFLERAYERVVISTLVSGWLVLLLAEVGVFSLWLHLALLALLCGGLLLRARRSPTPARSPPSSSRRALLEIVAFALVGVLALLLVVPPFETILGVRDAGVYANAGFAIARTGSLVQYDEAVARLGTQAQAGDDARNEAARQALSNFLGVQHPERFVATRMRAPGFFINAGDISQGRVVPQGFHLLPAWIALLTAALGVYGGLFAPGLMGVLGAWSVGMLGRRLAGPWVGGLAFLFLALNGVQVWFARYSTSETTAQFLTFAGLYCFARFQQSHEQSEQGEQGEQTAQPMFYAALAGVAFGQVALTRIDCVLVLVPLLLYLLYCWLAHRWSSGHTALALGAGAMMLHAGLHVLFIARAYFFDTAYARLQDYALTAYMALPFITPLLREVYHTRTGSPLKDPLAIWRELAAVAAGVAAMLALWRWPRPLHWLEQQARHQRALLAALAALVIVALAAHAYLVRPQILSPRTLAALPSCLLPQQVQNPSDECLTLQGYIGAPVAIPQPAPAVDPVRVRKNTPYDYYKRGAQALLVHMGSDHPRYAEAASYQEQLLATIEQAQQHNSASLQQERAALIAQLDGLSHDATGFSFEKLCELNVFSPKKDQKYVIPRANLVRVGWYLSPPGVVLGVLGVALWWWRGLNRASWFFLVVGFVGTFFYVRDTYGTSEQTYIYILRRFVAIAYPTFSLGMAYILAAPREHTRWRSLLLAGQAGLVGVLVLFFIWTGRPIYRHVEYQGAVEQIHTLAETFNPGDILLLRGGGPTYGHFRDVPDIVATPLHFLFGRDSFTIKSGEPQRYADALAAQIRAWQEQGHAVYMLLSASGGDFVPPGYQLRQVGVFTLRLPEFEQLTNQKPRNVSSLTLPLAIYRLDEASEQEQHSSTSSLDVADFAAQVRGFYLPEGAAQRYAWTDGDALLRLPLAPLHAAQHPPPSTLSIWLGSGKRPPHLGPARACLSLVAEPSPHISSPSAGEVSLGCITLSSTIAEYSFDLAPDTLAALRGTVLLRITSEAWVPAEEDPHQHDHRPVGVQFHRLLIKK